MAKGAPCWLAILIKMANVAKNLWRVSETFNEILRGAPYNVEKLSKMVKIEKLEKISMGLANIQMTKMAKTCHFWRVFAKFVIFVVAYISGHKRQRPKWQCSSFTNSYIHPFYNNAILFLSHLLLAFTHNTSLVFLGFSKHRIHSLQRWTCSSSGQACNHLRAH